MKRCVQLWLLLAAASAQAHPARAQALCATDESTYFSCASSNGRAINLCGKPAQTLQYRFGKPGRVELAYPAQPQDSLNAFWYAHYARAQTERIEIRFDNAGTEYVLFDYTEDGRRQAGVRVTRESKESNVVCRGPIRSRLSELQGKLKCDTDNALAAGTCR